MSSALSMLVQKHPEIAPAADILRILATALPEPTLPTGVPHLPAAEARLAAGIPALADEPLLNGSALLANIRVLASTLGEALEATDALPELLESLGGSDADSLVAAALTGTWDPITETARRAGLDEHFVLTIVDHAARPALRAGAAAVRELMAQCRWTRGTCPACGAAPLLGELRSGGTVVGGAEQERVLRCGRCMTGWGFPRLRCFACGETRHQQLSYLHGNGEGAFRRAEVCSTCGHYIKSIAVLTPLTYIELLDEDLATAALDIGAVDHGFRR
jgi:FdhE protein